MSEPKYAAWQVRYEMTVLPGTEFAFPDKVNQPLIRAGGIHMDQMFYRPAGKLVWCIVAPKIVDTPKGTQ